MAELAEEPAWPNETYRGEKVRGESESGRGLGLGLSSGEIGRGWVSGVGDGSGGLVWVSIAEVAEEPERPKETCQRARGVRGVRGTCSWGFGAGVGLGLGHTGLRLGLGSYGRSWARVVWVQAGVGFGGFILERHNTEMAASGRAPSSPSASRNITAIVVKIQSSVLYARVLYYTHRVVEVLGSCADARGLCFIVREVVQYKV